MNLRRYIVVGVLSSVLAACASAPPAAPPAPRYDSAPIIAAINQAAAPVGRELVVKPVLDPASEGVREDAAELQSQGRLDEAGTVLDAALETRTDDPVLLQARAENAVLRGDLAAAERFARRATAAGAQAGPQCRRHWETLVQVLAVQGAEAADLEAARNSRAACTVAAPPRY